jgi:hypothetical protein
LALDSSARLGCFAAVVAAWDAGTYLLIHRLSGMFNDFDFYWASARLITRGRDPYDLVQMHQVLASIGLHPSSAMGYAYPLALAYLMVPLSFLPPLVAGLVFSGISLVALAAAATMLLAPLRGLWWVERLAIAFAIGSFVPITGSLRMGQINLLVLLLLVVAFRGLARASTLALAGAIKLSPVVGLFSFPPSQWWSRRGLLGGAAIFGIVTVLPSLVARGARLPVLGMLAPDAYYTNESVNGFVGRLGGAIWHTAPALLPRLPLEPTMLASVAVLAAVTVAVVLVNGWRSTDGVLGRRRSAQLAVELHPAPHHPDLVLAEGAGQPAAADTDRRGMGADRGTADDLRRRAAAGSRSASARTARLDVALRGAARDRRGGVPAGARTGRGRHVPGSRTREYGVTLCLGNR